jgi:hypothetical protein
MHVFGNDTEGHTGSIKSRARDADDIPNVR